MSDCPKFLSTNVDSGTEHGSTFDFFCRHCGYRFDADDEPAAPATPAATPLREANQQRVDAAARRVRQALALSNLPTDNVFRKDVELLIEIALAPVLEIFAAAQPQRESEQPEQALRRQVELAIIRYQILLNRMKACGGDHGVSNIEVPGWICEAKDALSSRSEQPEQVADWARAQAYDLASEFHKLGQSSKDKSVARAYFDCALEVENAFVQIIHEQAALSPQTDSQEPR